tara:strand:+ start:431 stop:655 length:225 start_codon:yes stop_codon:yes gene_type:complete
MVMVVAMVIVVCPTDNGFWDVPANINIYVMCVNPMTVMIVAGWDIMLFNSTYLLHHGRHRGFSLSLCRTTECQG